MRYTKYAIAWVACVLFSAPALAETISTQAGKEVRLRVSYTCSPTQPGRDHVLTNPANGVITQRDSAPPKTWQCPRNGNAPQNGVGIFYKPNPGFRGTDRVAFEWGGLRRKGSNFYDYMITVH